MSNTEYGKPKRLKIDVETKDVMTSEGKNFVSQNNIFAFRTGSVNLTRWSIIDIGVNLPADPRTVCVQIKFPPNTDLGVSDNFATLVSIATRSLIRVNVWRVDSGDDPAIDYQFDVLITI